MGDAAEQRAGNNEEEPVNPPVAAAAAVAAVAADGNAPDPNEDAVAAAAAIAAAADENDLGLNGADDPPAEDMAAANRKLSQFESGTGTDWRTWRAHYETVVAINNWPDLRQRLELKAAMMGAAARMTSDIVVIGDDKTAAGVLADYQGRFLPPAAGKVARAAYAGAKQGPEETVMQFHSRLRDLFGQAYPEQMANLNQNRMLVQTFASGLENQEITRWIMDRDPETYSAALDLAQMKAATEMVIRHSQGKPVNTTLSPIGSGNTSGHSTQNSSMNQTGGGTRSTSRPGRTITCWGCKETGHFKSQCPQRKPKKKFPAKPQVAGIQENGSSSGATSTASEN